MSGRINNDTPLSWANVVQLGTPSSDGEEITSVMFRPISPPNGTRKRIFTRVLPLRESPVTIAICERNEEEARRLLLENHSLLERGNEFGRTPLALACCLGLSQEFVRFLLSLGAKSSVVDCHGETPHYFAASQGFSHLLKLLPHDPSLQFVMDHKVLGHLFALRRKGKWRGEFTFDLEGFDTPCLTEVISTLLSQYVQLNPTSYFTPEEFKEFQFYFYFFKGPWLNHNIFVDMQQCGGSYVLPTGWWEHRLILVFWKEYLFICDPANKPTVTLFKIDPSLFTQAILDEIGEMEFRALKQAGWKYIYRTLPRKLGSAGQRLNKWERRMFTAMRSQAPAPPVANVCSFASQMETLFVLGCCQKFADSTHDSKEEVVAGVAGEIERMHVYMQAAFLSKFIHTYARDEHVDRALIRLVARRVMIALPRHFNLADLRFSDPERDGETLSGEDLLQYLFTGYERFRKC